MTYYIKNIEPAPKYSRISGFNKHIIALSRELAHIVWPVVYILLINCIAYGTRRFNAAFTRALK
jgi:hypothetical protein